MKLILSGEKAEGYHPGPVTPSTVDGTQLEPRSFGGKSTFSHQLPHRHLKAFPKLLFLSWLAH